MRRTRNAVCPLDIGGSNPSLSAKQMNENKKMRHILKSIPLFLILISCSKPVAINELKGDEGIAIVLKLFRWTIANERDV